MRILTKTITVAAILAATVAVFPASAKHHQHKNLAPAAYAYAYHVSDYRYDTNRNFGIVDLGACARTSSQVNMDGLCNRQNQSDGR